MTGQYEWRIARRACKKEKPSGKGKQTPGHLTGGLQDWCSYAPSGEDCAQGTAHAPHGPLDGLGCLGLGMRLLGRVLASGMRKHFALPVTAEFRGGVKVREHELSP
jgi:hypothetical protein